MNYTLFFIPFVSALVCWLMIKIAIKSIFWKNGIIRKLKGPMSATVAASASKEILHSSFITDKLTGPETLEKAMPAIESHIDHFLNHKLKEAIPVISMFVGDKITNQLKELFLEELKELFPSIMSQFIGNLSQSGELEKEIELKLQSVSIAEIKHIFYKQFGTNLTILELSFAVAGLIAGFIQLALTLSILK